MDIWSTLLAENLNRNIEDQDIAWSYSKAVFTPHQSSSTLNATPFDAAIIRNNSLEALINPDLYKIQNHEHFIILIRKELDQTEQFFLFNYWTLIMNIKLNKNKTPLLLVHMASSLDGKIATRSGHSKWIGNQENLIHAHRLRAISDGILVGSYTVKNDNPKLNVRLVEGKNPIRLILSNVTNSFNDLQEVADTKTYLLRNKKFQHSTCNYPFDKVIYFENIDNECALTSLLTQIKELGINSILIEGGPTTVSSFIKAGLVNIFQLHLAPILLGSGMASLVLPEIKEISDGLIMKNSYYTPMGDSMMITGSL